MWKFTFYSENIFFDFGQHKTLVRHRDYFVICQALRRVTAIVKQNASRKVLAESSSVKAFLN